MKNNSKEIDDKYLFNLTRSLDEKIINSGYAVISDSCIKNLANSARSEYYKNFTTFNLKPQTEKFDHLDVQKKPVRKLAIGSSNGIGNPIAQFLQSTYFGSNSKDLKALSSLARVMIRLRNYMSDMKFDFGENPNMDKFWNASRIHHYPSGGGFMSRHHDSYFPKVMNDKKIPFLQLILLLSKKGEDFSSGGGYIIPRGERSELINLEDKYNFGDIIVFDGTIEHGVETIDSHLIPDYNSINGRLSFLVGLYEVQKS